MRRALFGLLVALAALVPGHAPAQEQMQEQMHGQPFGVAKPGGSQLLGLRHGSFILAPVPISNPTIGTGLALGGGYLFQLDKKSDPSFVGIGGLGTDNESRAYALGANINFDRGRFNLHGMVGEASLFYDLYVLGVPFKVRQDGILARLGGTYGLTRDLSLGLDLGYLDSDLGTTIEGPLADNDIWLDFGVASATADLVLEYDSRDDTIYPTRGAKASLQAGWGTTIDEGVLDRDFGRIVGQYAAYVPLSDRLVLAGEVTGCGVDRATPFYLSCLLGATDSLRGYSPTEYFGDALVSAQIALRAQPWERVGFAVFGGAGRVAWSWSGLETAEGLYAGGVGFRYRVSRKFPVDFSVDVALNRFDETSTYVYVGQRF